ncbi:proline-rich receptor-like protein kinase PERK2 [Iris pallida]|uniref:Proline-rich receptor-like protein kinase PERK2 n=1 Tax=Iris pallida TaxID=29817 RepID=A0AAX6G986_IRIPA|nr:proline-rich receptor-like protein kinase PERK2 [Iris pallida]
MKREKQVKAELEQKSLKVIQLIILSFHLNERGKRGVTPKLDGEDEREKGSRVWKGKLTVRVSPPGGVRRNRWRGSPAQIRARGRLDSASGAGVQYRI